MIVILLAMLGQAPASTVPMKTIEKGMDSQVDKSQQVAARSAEEWAKLWNLHAGKRPRPSVDFAREMVVGVFLGSRPTGGFSIEVVGAREEGGALVVQYRETRPPPRSVTAQILSSPYHLVTFPARAGTVRFEKIE